MISSILGGFSNLVALIFISADVYSKFIKSEKRSTFLRIQAASEPKNNSAGFGNVSDDPAIVPKAISDCLIWRAAFCFEVELAEMEYFIGMFYG